MPGLKPTSSQKVVKILCNEFGFSISGRSESHVRLSKMAPEGTVGTVVPMHKELKLGTLRSVLKLAKIDTEEFEKHQ